jgi:hypothetical protein
MHHPDICDILLVIQDFLLLSEDYSNCEIIPQHCHGHQGYNNQVIFGQIRVRRKLSSGWIEFTIRGLEEDDNTITFEYLSGLEPREIIKTIEIKDNDYCIVRVRDAIREILTMDKNPEDISLDAIRKGINSLPSNETTKAKFRGN